MTTFIPYSTAKDQINVIIRIRPFLSTINPISKYLSSPNPNKAKINPIINMNNNPPSPLILDEDDTQKIRVGRDTTYYESYYDRIFQSSSSQSDIYKYVNFCIGEASKGINSTILAYGQTGSGKTYTMFGEEWTSSNSSENDYINDEEYNFLSKRQIIINPSDEKNGIIPRIINDIFRTRISSDFYINCSYLQVYNERLYDLLENYDNYENKNNADISSNKKPFRICGKNDYMYKDPVNLTQLHVKSNKEIGIYIEGLSQHTVDDFHQCMSLLKIGEQNRKKRQTSKNELSSRSHTIFMITINSKHADKEGYIIESRMNFCDLAGSEKYDKNYNYNKFHMKELTNINKSLTTLGQVINALANKKKHVPFRDSKLTLLLQNSLGGNTRTVLIGNIAPEMESYDETVNTLKFADRVHSLFVKIEPNKIKQDAYDFNSDRNNNCSDILINKLSNQVKELKMMLSYRQNDNYLRKENELYNNYNNNNDNEAFFKFQIQKLRKENEMLKKELKKRNYINNANFNTIANTKYNNDLSNNVSSSNQSSINMDNNNINNTDLSKRINYKLINNNVINVKNSIDCYNNYFINEDLKRKRIKRSVINSMNNLKNIKKRNEYNLNDNNNNFKCSAFGQYQNNIVELDNNNSLKINHNNSIKFLNELKKENDLKLMKEIEELKKQSKKYKKNKNANNKFNK